MQGYFRDATPHSGRAGARSSREGRARLAVARAQFRDRCTDAAISRLHLLRARRASPVHAGIGVRLCLCSEDKDSISELKVQELRDAYLAKAKRSAVNDEANKAIQTYFALISSEIRQVEHDRIAAEPRHLEALRKFAGRAYRRPLSRDEGDGLIAFYNSLRENDGLSHEDAIRDTVASVLLSPHFAYRVDLAEPGAGARPLSSYELASRLSYFLWSSMPDEELLSHAASCDLGEHSVLLAQTQRMLRDARIRRFATEFAGNWLGFRRFEEHNAVDRERFPSFTSELRQAMFEEPIRFFETVVNSDRSVLDLLYGDMTFVNPVLAKHYGMPVP